MLYLRMALFLLSFLGIYLFLKKTIKIDSKIVLPITVISITLFLLLFSVVFLLKVGFILLTIFGLISLIYYLIKKEIDIKSFLQTDNIIFMILLIYLIIICQNLNYTHYDNYTHWGLIVRLIVENNNLPTSLDVLSYPSYPPGTALFISYFSFICNNATDGVFIIAQNLIILSFVKGMYNLIDTKKVFLKRLLFLLTYLFINAYLIAFNDLLVENVLLIVFAFELLCLVAYQKNVKKLFLPLLLTGIYLYLVKNVGLLLSLVTFILFYKKYKNKKDTLYLILGLIIAYFVWNVFAMVVYGTDYMSTKHVLNPAIYIKTMGYKGLGYCLKYFGNYLLIFFNIKDYTSNLMFVILNLIMIITSIKDFKIKNILKLDLIYVLYFIGLGLMYVFSMPVGEASYYACYNRYMMVPLLLIIFILVYKAIKNNNKVLGLIYSLSLLVGISFNITTLKPFLGIDDYNNSRMFKYNQIVDNLDLNNKIVAIYTNESNKDDFIMCYTIYRLRTKKFYILNETPPNYVKIDVVITYDYNEHIDNDLKMMGYNEISKYVYVKEL